MAKINFGGVVEEVLTREEFPMEKALAVLKDEVIAILGYGVQGPAQALNLRDNGFKVIVGQRKGSKTWNKALEHGWVEGETLFDIEEAAKRGTILQYLLSDAGQIALWPKLKPYLTKGKTLYFSHGFGITFKDQTGIVPPPDVDVILVAPKGSGTSVRRLFLQGKGINSSYAIFQDASGKAKEKAYALGIGVGSGYLFQTDFKKEVYSDLAGERGTLMGAIAGIFEAQYEVLRANGHTPSEAVFTCLAYFNKIPFFAFSLGAFHAALRLASVCSSTSKLILWPLTSISIMSPSSTSAITPPSKASGVICPTTNP